MRAIDGDKLVEGLELMAKYQTGVRQSAILGVCDTIRWAPAIDAVLVIHARWDEHCCSNCKNEAPLLYECERDCDGFAWFHSEYCPYCGAKMDA